MIVTCNKCTTNYNLDEAVLKPGGATVRCSVCNNVFKIFPPGLEDRPSGLEVPDFEPEPGTETMKKGGPAAPYSGNSSEGMIADLELDEKSLGIDDIIDDIIFIPKDPGDIEFIEKQTAPEKPSPLKPGAEDNGEPITPLEPDTESGGDMTDLDWDDDFSLDGEDDSKATAEEPLDHEKTLDSEEPLDSKEILDSEELIDHDEPLDIDAEFLADDVGEPSEKDSDTESVIIEEDAVEDTPEEILEDVIEKDIEDIPGENLELESQETLDDKAFDELTLEEDDTSVPEPEEDEEQVVETDDDMDVMDDAFVDDDTDDLAFDSEDTDDFAVDDGTEPSGIDFEIDFETDELSLNDDADDDTLDFSDGTLEFIDSEEAEAEDNDIEEGDLDDEFMFEDSGTADESDFEVEDEPSDDDIEDGFEFDTEGELLLEDDEYDDEEGLIFEPDDTADGLDDDDVLSMDDEPAMEDMPEDDDLSMADELDLDETDDDEVFAFEAEEDEDLVLDETAQLPDDVETKSEPGTQKAASLDDIPGAFELEFDMDPDLGLDNDDDMEYLARDNDEDDAFDFEDDEDETLEMLEIEARDDGDAFLEDLSEESDSSDYDESLEQDAEPEVIIETDDDQANLTQASIQRPGSLTPPPARPRAAKTKKRKKGGSIIVKLFLLILFLAILTLAGYSASVMTGYHIPYLSDLEIPLVDEYLKPPVPQPEPAKVFPIEPSVSARFVANENAGTLFVITGKVINDSSIFIRHAMVEGSLVTKNKEKVKRKIVYCGNILNEEQLEKSSIEEINSMLSQKSGEDSINDRIKPRGMIQFMIVFSDLPDLLQNFEVKVAGFDRITTDNQN